MSRKLILLLASFLISVTGNEASSTNNFLDFANSLLEGSGVKVDHDGIHQVSTSEVNSDPKELSSEGTSSLFPYNFSFPDSVEGIEQTAGQDFGVETNQQDNYNTHGLFIDGNHSDGIFNPNLE